MLLGTAACTPREPEQERIWDESQTGVAACDEPALTPDVLKRQRLADEALRKALLAAGPDPAVEARKAVVAGDFRLAAAMTMDAAHPRLYGAQCRIAGGLDPWMARVIGVEGEDAADDRSGAERAHQSRVASFGRRYNQALLADPRYPYSDVCRPGEDAGKASGAAGLAPEQAYGFPDLASRPIPATLADAARRGDTASLGRMLRSGRHDVNAADMFGLTALAWAIAYRESDAVEALLRAKASPAGSKCQSLLDASSPIQIARSMQWRSEILRMRSMVAPEEFDELAEQPQMFEKEEMTFRLALIELAKRHEEELARQESSVQLVTIAVDDAGKALSCKLEPGTPLPVFDREVCTLAMNVLRFRPARNTFGTAVPGEFTVAVRTMGK
ncbi:ankyrin repeat domain-containing protein [Novosphingobium album (ex Liu et al. 2023)]|nr:ankyrin repeat domain-containing protein [Novosphingobium album (ex Liu et al. 2023)]